MGCVCIFIECLFKYFLEFLIFWLALISIEFYRNDTLRVNGSRVNIFSLAESSLGWNFINSLCFVGSFRNLFNLVGDTTKLSLDFR